MHFLKSFLLLSLFLSCKSEMQEDEIHLALTDIYTPIYTEIQNQKTITDWTQDIIVIGNRITHYETVSHGRFSKSSSKQERYAQDTLAFSIIKENNKNSIVIKGNIKQYENIRIKNNTLNIGVILYTKVNQTPIIQNYKVQTCMQYLQSWDKDRDVKETDLEHSPIVVLLDIKTNLELNFETELGYCSCYDVIQKVYFETIEKLDISTQKISIKNKAKAILGIKRRDLEIPEFYIQFSKDELKTLNINLRNASKSICNNTAEIELFCEIANDEYWSEYWYYYKDELVLIKNYEGYEIFFEKGIPIFVKEIKIEPNAIQRLQMLEKYTTADWIKISKILQSKLNTN